MRKPQRECLESHAGHGTPDVVINLPCHHCPRFLSVSHLRRLSKRRVMESRCRSDLFEAIYLSRNVKYSSWKGDGRFFLNFLENRDFYFERTAKPPKTCRSDSVCRPRFHNGTDAFRPPRRPSKHRRRGLSDPPRPISTRLRSTCVAGRVVSYPTLSPSKTFRDRVVTPVVMSTLSSLTPSCRAHTS